MEVEIIDDLLTIVTKLLVSNMYQNVAEKTSQSSGEKSFSTSKHNIWILDQKTFQTVEHTARYKQMIQG